MTGRRTVVRERLPVGAAATPEPELGFGEARVDGLPRTT
jgi:hypothetical protein